MTSINNDNVQITTLTIYSTQKILQNLKDCIDYPRVQTLTDGFELIGATAPSFTDQDKKLMENYMTIVGLFEEIRSIQHVIENGQCDILQQELQRRNIRLTYNEKEVSNVNNTALYLTYPTLLANKLAHVGFRLSRDHSDETDFADIQLKPDEYVSFTMDNMVELHSTLKYCKALTLALIQITKDEFSSLLTATLLSDVYQNIFDKICLITGHEYQNGDTKKVYNKNNILTQIKQSDTLYKLIMTFVEKEKCTPDCKSTDEFEIFFNVFKNIRNSVMHPGGIQIIDDKYVLYDIRTDDENKVAEFTQKDILDFVQAIIDSFMIDLQLKVFDIPSPMVDTYEKGYQNKIQKLREINTGEQIKVAIANYKNECMNTVIKNRQAVIERIENGDEEFKHCKSLENYDFLHNRWKSDENGDEENN